MTANKNSERKHLAVRLDQERYMKVRQHLLNIELTTGEKLTFQDFLINLIDKELNSENKK